MSISSVPKSWIEGPGTILQRGISSLGSLGVIGTSQNHITRCPSRKPTNLLSEESLSEEIKIGTSSEGSLQKYCSDSHAGPGKLKTSADSLCTLVKNYKEFFELYDIQLSFQMPEKRVKEASLILNILRSEVCLLPYELMKKLEIKQITVSESPKTGDINFFSVETLDNQQKISTRFYEIVFEHLVALNSIFLCEWKSIVVRSGKEETWKLEEVFPMLMESANHASAQQKVTKLRHLLVKYFPEEMNEGYFQERAKQKKKMLIIT